MANLGIGLVGFWRTRDFALAAAIMVSCFLWGAASNHLQEIIVQDNYSPGNAGSIFYSDFLIPAFLWIGYFLWRKS